MVSIVFNDNEPASPAPPASPYVPGIDARSFRKEKGGKGGGVGGISGAGGDGGGQGRGVAVEGYRRGSHSSVSSSSSDAREVTVEDLFSGKPRRKSLFQHSGMDEDRLLGLVTRLQESGDEVGGAMYWTVRGVIESDRRHAAVWAFRISVFCVLLVAVENEAKYFFEAHGVVVITKLVMLAASMLTVILLHKFHRRQWMLEQLSRLSNETENTFFKSKRGATFLAESLLVLAQVPPFVLFSIRYRATGALDLSAMADSGVEPHRTVLVDGLSLDWFIILRLLLVIRFATFTSTFQKPGARLIAAFSKIQVSHSFTIRSAAALKPFRFLLSFIIPTFFMLGYGWYIVERQANLSGVSYLEGLWVVGQTIIAVGFGDLVPSAPFGRFFSVLIAFVGVLWLAILVTFLSDWLELGPTEARIVAMLVRSRLKKDLANGSATVIQKAVALHLARKTSGDDSPEARRAMSLLYQAMRTFRAIKTRSQSNDAEHNKFVVSEEITASVAKLKIKVAEARKLMGILADHERAYAALLPGLERHQAVIDIERRRIAEEAMSKAKLNASIVEKIDRAEAAIGNIFDRASRRAAKILKVDSL